MLSGFNDIFLGSDLVEYVYGQNGNDTINGGAGDDILFGEAGNDTLIGGAGADRIDGGAGIDTVDYSASLAAVTINILVGSGNIGGDAEGDTYQAATIENAIGTAFDDTIIGSNTANNLIGGDGNDLIIG